MAIIEIKINVESKLDVEIKINVEKGKTVLLDIKVLVKYWIRSKKVINFFITL